MLLSKNIYHDNLSKISYRLQSDINEEYSIFIITGENGVGKSRFIEGVFLKELKKNRKRILYFGQDIENQILSFNLINLVSNFIKNLREQGSFFKTIFLNDESHNSVKVDFDETSTLAPSEESKREFIINECLKGKNLDVVIFDEADKYFNSSDDFFQLIDRTDSKQFFIISHILGKSLPVIYLRKENKEVVVELLNN